MIKKYLAVALLSALFTGVVETSSALELSQYNKFDTVSRIINDSEVTDNLRKMLENHYQTFIDNFDVFGEPHTTKGGGLFVEGWLKDLYRENASALVINPDDKIFAAWVVPESDVIQYQSSDNSQVINADIQRWAVRFNTMHFATTEQSLVVGSETKKLDTEKFTISLINKCGHFDSECDKMYYLGMRKSDNSTISLKGKTVHDSAGKIIGSTYKNGEIAYTVTYAPVKLVVSKGNHVLVEQSGQWLK